MLSAELMTHLLQLDSEGISECYDVLKHRRASLDRDAKNQFTVGDKVWIEDKGKRIDCKVFKINRTRIIVRPLDGGRGWNCYPSSLHAIESPIISDEDVTKLNGAIEEAAHKIVNQNKPVFNPATGDFE